MNSNSNNNSNTRMIDYHTYKNKLLETYPESIIDIQLVYKDDDFTFSKENGSVAYNLSIKMTTSLSQKKMDR